jgi:hypothetical protein
MLQRANPEIVCNQRVQGEALPSSTLTQVKNSSYAGRLKSFYPKWRQLTSNPWVLSCVKGHKLPFTKTPLQAQAPAAKDCESMSKAVQELLIIGAMSPCSPRPGQYLSQVFLADKPNGQKRFILNLKHLNKCIAAPHFKMEDIRTAQRLVTKNCFAASIDLKDAYFLVRIENI